LSALSVTLVDPKVSLTSRSSPASAMSPSALLSWPSLKLLKVADAAVRPARPQEDVAVGGGDSAGAVDGDGDGRAADVDADLDGRSRRVGVGRCGGFHPVQHLDDLHVAGGVDPRPHPGVGILEAGDERGVRAAVQAPARGVLGVDSHAPFL